MTTLTVTAKGQVTLRKELLRHLGVEPGGKIELDVLPDGKLEVRAARSRRPISDVFGMLRQEGGPSLSIDEMNEIIADGWAGRL